MRRSLVKKVEQLLEAEAQHPVDEELLNKLRYLASQDTNYAEFGPEQRNALNEFFRETKDIFLGEMFMSNYSTDILLDALIVTSFEVGYKFGRGSSPLPKDTTNSSEVH